MSTLQQIVVSLHMLKMRLGPWACLKRQANYPAATQRKLLRKILRSNATTELGRAYMFGTMSDAEAYIRAVPIHDYEALRPAIDRQMETGEPTLSAAPVRHYLLTSGTTGEPKRIPLTAPLLKKLRACQRLAAYTHFREAPRLFSGKLFSITGAGTEGYFPNGTPYGCLSGVLHDAMTRFMRRRSIPSVAAGPAPSYETMVREAMAAPDITAAISANPSSFLRLKQWMLTRQLIRPDQRLGDLWPQMQGIITWTRGNCATYLPALQQEFPNAKILEAGYLASELYGTIPVGDGRCVPSLAHYFFEFIPVDAWENGERETCLLHQLQPDAKYYVIITNESGLYRYFMHDIVQVDGFFGTTPCLRFLQKGKGVTSLTGEKLYETQLLLAMQTLWGSQADASFFMALAHTTPAHYRVYIETETLPADFASTLDAALSSLNIEYQAKRASQRLHSVQPITLRAGAGDAYRQHCIARGQREAQWKLVRLHYADQFDFDFTPYLHEPV